MLAARLSGDGALNPGVELIDVGPTPQKVLAVIQAFEVRWMGETEWSMDTFNHRTKGRPVTLFTYGLAPGFMVPYCRDLEAAGATLRIEKSQYSETS